MNSGLRWKSVAKIYRGTRVVKEQLFDDGYPVYQNSLVPMGYMDAFNREENMTFVICAGAAGDIGFSREKMWAADDCYCFESSRLDQRFLCMI